MRQPAGPSANSGATPPRKVGKTLLYDRQARHQAVVQELIKVLRVELTAVRRESQSINGLAFSVIAALIYGIFG